MHTSFHRQSVHNPDAMTIKLDKVSIDSHNQLGRQGIGGGDPGSAAGEDVIAVQVEDVAMGDACGASN